MTQAMTEAARLLELPDAVARIETNLRSWAGAEGVICRQSDIRAVLAALASQPAVAVREPLTEQAEEAAWQQHGRKAGWLSADGSLAEGADASKAQIAYFNFKAGMQFAHGIPARGQQEGGV